MNENEIEINETIHGFDIQLRAKLCVHVVRCQSPAYLSKRLTIKSLGGK